MLAEPVVSHTHTYILQDLQVAMSSFHLRGGSGSSRQEEADRLKKNSYNAAMYRSQENLVKVRHND